MEIKIKEEEKNYQEIESFPPSVVVSIRKPVVEWVSIAEGRFMMGSLASDVKGQQKDEQHEVELSAFMMGKYAVSFEQYDMYCEAVGCEKPDDNGWGRGKRPVINVNWYDAKAFADFMGCRLPTEAEWEYACRAGSTTKFYTGNTIAPSVANFRGGDPYNTEATKDFMGKTMPVGSYAPNAWGLYDMHGNVCEWCMDFFSEFSSERVRNPRGPLSGKLKIARGGDWSSFADVIYSASRYFSFPDEKSQCLGFRLVFPK
jgi:formylglycine-generating enzyme required for sulfatase activity